MASRTDAVCGIVAVQLAGHRLDQCVVPAPGIAGPAELADQRDKAPRLVIGQDRRSVPDVVGIAHLGLPDAVFAAIFISRLGERIAPVAMQGLDPDPFDPRRHIVFIHAMILAKILEWGAA